MSDADRQKIAEALVKKKLNPQTNMGPPEPPKERSLFEILKDELLPEDPKAPKQIIHRAVRG